MRYAGLLAFLMAALIQADGAVAASRLIDAGPDSLEKARSLAAIIKRAQQGPIHIIYVHGMRAESEGASTSARQRILKHLAKDGPATVARSPRHYVNLGPWPQSAYIGEPGRKIWLTQSEWDASTPFVDRYILTQGNKRIILDEVNWWPLLFALKCRFILVPEHDLSGNDRKHLRLCANSEPPYYPWITEIERDRLLASRPISGGGSWPNSQVKRQILNWGLSDAVIALGPMRGFLIDTMNQAFGLPADEQKTPYVEQVVMAESLGSFVVLDALRERAPNVLETFKETYSVYFFANQFALLELARIEGLPPSPAMSKGMFETLSPTGPPAPHSALAALAEWSQLPRPQSLMGSDAPSVRQVLAFSDPSDMLTYPLPRIGQAHVVNVYVRTTGGPFKLFANPAKAHRGHITDPDVWKQLLK